VREEKGGKITILIVENDIDFRKLIAGRSGDYSVVRGLN